MTPPPSTIKPLRDHAAPLRGILKTTSSSFDKFALLLPIGATYTIGREKDCDVVVKNPFISRSHLTVGVRMGPHGLWQAWIRDEGSRNQTFIHDARLAPQKPYLLQEEFEVALGDANSEGATKITYMELEPDSTFSRYSHFSRLGQGGFGEVYLCYHRSSGVPYALKVLEHSEETAAYPISRECRVARSLKHPNIVHTVDTIREADRTFIVMEWAAPGTLHEYLQRRGGRVDEKTAQDLALQLCDGVGYMHARGLMHRDIKPGNILVACEEPVFIKLADFGLTKPVGPAPSIAGTPPYIAPEIFRLANYDVKVDCFSVGCIIFQMIAGFMPFAEDDLKIKTPTFELIKDSRGLPRFDKAQTGTFSPEAREVIAALLNPNPGRRPQIHELYAYKWLQDARRRACRRELCLA